MATSLLTFAAFEFFPPLLERVDLWPIRYYAIKRAYVADPTLVLRYPRSKRWERSSSFQGDLYEPFLGVEAPVVQQSRSYDARGFRVGRAQPPFEAVAIGDSYLEVGETDADTLTELLAAASGRSVLNLGRGFYGPYQYVEVLRRYALPEHPRLAFFFFFSGNDVADIQEYERWLHEEHYYFFEDLSRKHFLERYWMALSDVLDLTRKVAKAGLAAFSRRNGKIHPELAVLGLGERRVVVRMKYWDSTLPADEILASSEWKSLRLLLAEFQSLCDREGITPIVVFIPTKSQIYAPHATSESGEQVLQRLPAQLRFGRSSAQGLARVAAELDLRLIDLTPRFESLAAQGRLLYHPFDTHWNREGREAAAEFITETLGWKPKLAGIQSSAGR